jgi:metal-dependent amidase/aminoacylase/carboxypeptidase family protein
MEASLDGTSGRELESLELEVLQLQEKLEEASEKLHKAGELGNALLATNQQLNEDLEARGRECAEQLEVSYCTGLLGGETC